MNTNAADDVRWSQDSIKIWFSNGEYKRKLFVDSLQELVNNLSSVQLLEFADAVERSGCMWAVTGNRRLACLA